MSYTSLLINWCSVWRHSQANIVVGTDGNDYHCIVAHTATADKLPITGVYHATYWQPTGGTGAGVIGAVWVLGTAYIAYAAIDDYGLPVKDWDYVHELGDVRCRIEPAKGKEVLVGAEVVVADYKLFMLDVIITEQDKVDVYWGTIDGWKEYEILLVEDMQDGTDSHHKECWLRTVR